MKVPHTESWGGTTTIIIMARGDLPFQAILPPSLGSLSNWGSGASKLDQIGESPMTLSAHSASQSRGRVGSLRLTE